MVPPAGCMSLVTKKWEKAGFFYFQMNHTKTQEKELLGIKRKILFLKVIFFVGRVMLLSKVWNSFFFLSTHPAQQIFYYIALLVKIHTCHKVFDSMCHPKPQMPSVELGFSSRSVERRKRILQHTWRLITVFIILISFRISFPIGNLELKTSVCDSLLWCWDLFQQPAAAWVAQGRVALL